MSVKVEETIASVNGGVNISKARLNKQGLLKDADWLKRGFMISGKSMYDASKEKMYASLYASTADNKFHESGLGRSRSMNPKPQFTRYCDPRRTGRIANKKRVKVSQLSSAEGHGQGRYWSEAFDDNANHLMLTPSMPHFQSLFTFASRAVDLQMFNVATTGGPSGYAYLAGKAIGAAAVIMAFPMVGIVGNILRLANYFTTSAMDDSYYTAKPALDLYWSTVNTLVTYMSTNIGFVSTDFASDVPDDGKMGVPLKISSSDMSVLRDALPGIFTSDNYVDVFALANRLPMHITKQLELEKEFMDTDNIQTYHDALAKYNRLGTKVDNVSFDLFLKGIRKSLSKKTKEENTTGMPGENPSATSDKEQIDTARQADGSYLKTMSERADTAFTEMSSYFKAASSHGSHFVTYEIDHIGTTTDSFSNTFKDIPTKETFNSSAGAVRDIRFSMAGGNVAGEAIQTLVKTGTDLVFGALDGATFGLSNVIKALMGGGNVDMPQMWADSSTNVATHTFKTTLIAPYGHPLASLQSLYIPLAGLLALVLPLETGRSSHVSPMLVKAFLKGLVDIKLGMFKDLSVTRGATNLSQTRDHRPLSFEITFSIVDLVNMTAAPVPTGSFGAVELTFDDVNPLNRYLNAITGQDVRKVTYIKPKVLLAYSRLKHGAEAVFNRNRIAQSLGNTILGDISLFLQPDNHIDSLSGF